MTKIDIISGFLGAGKTTLIKKLFTDAFPEEKVVLIENEFGEIGVDSGFLKDAGVEITEMSQGCICCSLVGDFGEALKKVVTEYNPDRVIIEPSGVGKLSDVTKAVVSASEVVDIFVNSATTVCDVAKCKMYMKNFGEFFNDQVEHAGTIVLSRTQSVPEKKILEACELLKEHNDKSVIITTPWDDIDAKVILDAMEHSNTLEELIKEAEHKLHHHHHDEEECDDPNCSCHDHKHHHDHEHHHHDHEDGECCCGHEHDHHHEHHHHDHDHEHDHHHDHEDGECCCGHDHEHEHEHHDHEHEHHHEHGEGCTCGCHDHDHHHHHADDVFTSWGKETAVKFDREKLNEILDTLAYEGAEYGVILRAKGIVPDTDGKWINFDLVPGEYEIRDGVADYTGKLCVIGSNLNEDKLAELFGV